MGLSDTIFGCISFKTRYCLALLFGYYNNAYNDEYDSCSQQMALVLVACWCFTCNTVTIFAGLVEALLEESGMILSAFRWAWLSFVQQHTGILPKQYLAEYGNDLKRLLGVSAPQRPSCSCELRHWRLVHLKMQIRQIQRLHSPIVSL